MKIIRIKMFDPGRLKDKSDISLILESGTCTCKSSLAKNLVFHKKASNCVAINPTEESEHFYSEFMSSLYIHNEYSAQLFEQIWDRQAYLKRINKDKEQKDHFLCILDNCLHESKEQFNSGGILGKIFLNHRFIDLSLILTSSDPLILPPDCSNNLNYIFIGRTESLYQRKVIWQKYANVMDLSFVNFCTLLDNCSTDNYIDNHKYLVIDNTTRSEQIEDKIFWYQAGKVSSINISEKIKEMYVTLICCFQRYEINLPEDAREVIWHQILNNEFYILCPTLETRSRLTGQIPEYS